MPFDDDFEHLDARARRQLKDQRRMRFRRAIEGYEEHCRLQELLADYPDLGLTRRPAARADAR